MASTGIDWPSLLKQQKSDFLEAIRTGNASEWVLVMGNESADLDSLVSSIAFAFFAGLSGLSPQKYIPLYQQRSELLHLRAENLYAFDRAHLAIQDVTVLLDELTADALTSAGVKVALVDHNKLGASWGDAQVVSIIDHHQDEGFYPDASPRFIQVPTGSCSALVTTHFNSYVNQAPPQLTDLLLSALLIDTANFKPSAGKATPTDKEALKLLVDSLSASSPTNQVNLKMQYSTLKERKFDVSRLSSFDLLVRDYKNYKVNDIKYSLSTVPLAFSQWTSKFGVDDIANAVKQLLAERSLDFCGILTSSIDKDQERRQIIVVFPRDELLALKAPIEKESAADLNLVAFPDDRLPQMDGLHVIAWTQGVGLSRKYSAPAFMRAVQSLPSGSLA